MTTSVSFDRSMIAPCGINCGTCMAYLRVKNKCYGCWVDFDSKRKTCNARMILKIMSYNTECQDGDKYIPYVEWKSKKSEAWPLI